MGIWVASVMESGGSTCLSLCCPRARLSPLRRTAAVLCFCSLPWARRRRGDIGGLQVDGVDGNGDKVCKQRVLPCTLDKATQDLVSLIFSSDMFRDAMQTMNIGRR